MRQSTRREVDRIASTVAQDVVLRHVRRQLVSQDFRDLVKVEVIRELAKLDGLNQEAKTLVRNLATEAAIAVIRDAQVDLGPLVRKEVAAALSEFVPPVVTVNLPIGRSVQVTGYSHHALPELLLALGARCHVLLVGPAGTGKSMLAKQAAEALYLDFHALSLGPTTPMSKVFGYYDAHGHYHATPFREAFEHGGMMLLDELDNGHPGLLAEMNQALSLGTCAFADGMVQAHENFRLIATGNTYGSGGDRQYVGRQALDGATLDRFVVIDVPIDTALERRLVLSHAPTRRTQALELLERIRRLRSVAEEKGLPVMFSPRASIDGAKLLEAGAGVDQVIRWRIIRGLSAAHRSALGLPARETADGLTA